VFSARRAPSVVRTSGISGPPSVINISPFDRGVTVGYQRAATMSGPRLHVLVSESKTCVWAMASSRVAPPPATNKEPSTRWARPLQKMS
jgi:hypothetical protein